MTERFHPVLREALIWIQSQAWDSSFDDIEIAKPCNIVCTAQLALPRDNIPKARHPRANLEKPSRIMPHSKRNLSQFAAFKTTNKFPSATTLTFPTYTMVCVGANTTSGGEFALHRNARDLKPYCKWECFRDFTLNNIVCPTHVSHCIDLGLLAAENESCVFYNPTSFPGATYKTPPLPGAPHRRCVMIFDSSAVNIMGITSMKELLPITRHVHEFLRPYATAPRGEVEDITAVREAERQKYIAEKSTKVRKAFPFGSESESEVSAKRRKHSDSSSSDSNSEEFIEDE